MDVSVPASRALQARCVLRCWRPPLPARPAARQAQSARPASGRSTRPATPPPLATHKPRLPQPPSRPPAVYLIYLWAVRPYGCAVVGAFEVAGSLATLCMAGLGMAVMDQRGQSDVTR